MDSVLELGTLSNLTNFCRNISGNVHTFNQSSWKTKNQQREPKNVRKKLQWKKGSNVAYTSLLNSRNFLLVNGRCVVSNPFTTVATVSSSSSLKVVCPPIRLGNGHFSLLRSVDRGIPKSRAALFTAPPECTARTASRTCSAVKRSRFCDILREKKQQQRSML